MTDDPNQFELDLQMPVKKPVKKLEHSWWYPSPMVHSNLWTSTNTVINGDVFYWGDNTS
jgi:hypothetical protein